MKLRKREGIYFVDLRTGRRRIRQSLRTRDAATARHRAEVLETRLSGLPPYHRISVEEFQKAYLDWSAGRKGPHTIRCERSILQDFTKAAPVKHLDQVTPKAADDFISAVAARQLGKETMRRRISPATVNNHLRTLRAIFEQALKWQYIPANPFRSVQRLTTDETIPRVLTLEELVQLMAKVRKLRPEILSLVEFYLLTGMRRSEALSLEWADVNFARGVIVLRKTKGKREGKRKLRFVPISPRVREILKSRRGGARPFEFLGDFITKAFIECARAAGLTDVSLHDLRRTFSSYLAERGLSPFAIARLLGHSDMQVTLDHYVNVVDEAVLSKMKEVERAIKRKALRAQRA